MPTPAFEGLLARYEPVIGLEVHCQLRTATKLFCGCAAEFGALPNHQTCPVCLGMPGALPVLNQQAVNYAIRLALAVGARLNDVSVFARKQYFYPDLPKGYQITQHDRPYCEGGAIPLSDGSKVTLTRIHLEEDAGKSVHGDQASYVDLNRAGVPLLEVVSRPELHTAEGAVDYLKRLRAIVRYLGICDGNLEEGSFRCDANVSLRPRGQAGLGTRCEIKNLNSFRNIERAIHYEILRQADLLDEGGLVEQQTLLFDAASGRTQAMRSKEESHDYRYVPDPDLGPLKLSTERIAEVSAALPELPEKMAQRFRQDYELTEYDAIQLTSEPDLARYFEQTVVNLKGRATPKAAANWILSELLRAVNALNWDLAALPIASEHMAELLGMVGDGTISGKIAKTVFEEMVSSGGDSPLTIVERRGLMQISDEAAIAAFIDQILAAHPESVDEYRAGKVKLFGFFVGQVMRQSGGRMNPSLVNSILKQRLDGT